MKNPFHIHGDFYWLKPDGSPIPQTTNVPSGKMIEVVRVCGRCGDRKISHWGTPGGEVLKDW